MNHYISPQSKNVISFYTRRFQRWGQFWFFRTLLKNTRFTVYGL